MPTPGKRQGHCWASRTGLPGQGEPPRTPRAIVSEHQGAAEPLHPQAAPPRCRANPPQLHTDSFTELPRDLQALGKHFEELTNYKRGKKKNPQSKKSCLLKQEHSLQAAQASSGSAAPGKLAAQPLEQGIIFSPVSIFSNSATTSRMENIKEREIYFQKAKLQPEQYGGGVFTPARATAGEPPSAGSRAQR